MTLWKISADTFYDNEWIFGVRFKPTSSKMGHWANEKQQSMYENTYLIMINKFMSI